MAVAVPTDNKLLEPNREGTLSCLGLVILNNKQ